MAHDSFTTQIILSAARLVLDVFGFGQTNLVDLDSRMVLLSEE